VARWPLHDGPVCPRCGAFLGSSPAPPSPFPCAPCASDPPAFDSARSLFPHAGDVRAAILAAKYAGRPFPASAVADRIRSALAEAWAGLIPDGVRPAVVPVPVHPWKYFRRGFNLPALVGERLARDLGWPFAPLLLSRGRGRTPQAGLPLSGRRSNVESAFRVPRGRRPPTRVLLLDDVYTSGATARECARALKTGGADHIVVVTVVRAVA